MEKALLSISPQEELKHVLLTQIIMNPHQPRRTFDPEELKELAQSIKSVGIIHPPLVRPLEGNNQYELIAGERRFRAAQLAQLETIPVYIRYTTNPQSAQAALIENVQRVDLNPLEIAYALQALIQEHHLKQEEVGKQIGKKRSTVANYLRLLTLPPHIQQSVSKEIISMGHAKAILALKTTQEQQLLHELILRDELTVREAEQAATRINLKVKKKQLSAVPRDFYLEQLAEKIQERLGTKAFIQAKGKRGRLCIDYYSLDDLDRLLMLLGVKQANDL